MNLESKNNAKEALNNFKAEIYSSLLDVISNFL